VPALIAAHTVPTVTSITAAAAVAAITPPTALAPSFGATTLAQESGDADELREKIRWIGVRHGKQRLQTLDDESRLLLVQHAAERAKLETVGLSFEDVYGVIDAETSWVPRTGMGKNGTPSYGLGQFEPATAKGLGLKDPHDPVEAVYAAAMNMRNAAVWASRRLASLKLTPEERADKLREGVSVYYNLSTKGRKAWTGLNTAKLPIETQRHIMNTRRGAQEAQTLAERLLAQVEDHGA
jgi:hypothetical protein